MKDLCTKKYLCSTFVRASSLHQAGFRAKFNINAAGYLNFTDEQMRRAGLNLPITNNPKPGDIVSGGPKTARKQDDAHTGIFIGNGLYVGQSPQEDTYEITGDKKGSTIKIRPVARMPYSRIIYRSTESL